MGSQKIRVSQGAMIALKKDEEAIHKRGLTITPIVRTEVSTSGPPMKSPRPWPWAGGTAGFQMGVVPKVDSGIPRSRKAWFQGPQWFRVIQKPVDG